MEELLENLANKAKACGNKTKIDRARKGAYVDCIVEIKQALLIQRVVGQSEQLHKTNCTLNRQTCVEGSACKYPHCHI